MNALTHALNNAQQQAVTAPDENILVLAGAGSGKTRVLTSRIAALIQTQHYSPFNILAVTFTNKAANEMRSRIEHLLGIPAQNLWIGTFHSIAHRILRIHAQEAGLNPQFQILDNDDQYRLVRRLIQSLGLDEKQWAPKQIQWFINAKKDEGLRAGQVLENGNMHTRTLIKIYQHYETLCAQSHFVDFGELMLRSYELFQKNAEILTHYQQRFQHILVDEFQDTNLLQYEWIKLLTPGGYLMAVGDDNQSIYGFRGAKVENMQKLQKDFHPLRIIPLEQNYRSTGNILKAANILISNNTQQLEKNLWTEDGDGELISVYAAFNEIDEARFIVSQIMRLHQQNYRYAECAVLYRSNAQSRVIEEALIQQNIPYRIYGGLRFFDRAEIKDALGYLRLISNPDDDGAFERIINLPTRGIGEQTLNILREDAREKQYSLTQAAQSCIQTARLSARASLAIQAFLNMLETFRQKMKDLNLSELTEEVLHTSGLIKHYQQEKGEKGQMRVENLEELISATQQFQVASQDVLPPLPAFLANAALEAGENQNANTEGVQLMSLHSAKGLEFPVVFLAGVEEGLFPHQLSLAEPHQLAEERRLCYVGITRAMKKLYITYAETRRLHGQQVYHRPSRFIHEIPKECLEEIRLRTQITRPAYISATASKIPRPAASAFISDSKFNLGQAVNHPTFGEGIIIAIEGGGDHARLQVKFKNAGTKWLVAAFANLI